jgi:hypothetical protein
MSHLHYSALLLDAPVNRHFAQIHQSPESLAAAVGLYIETGLKRHNGVIVIATAPNLDRFRTHLATTGLNATDFQKTGQLLMLDADEALGRIMNGDIPIWREFRRLVGGVLDKARAFDLTTTRAYGEMVNVLWRQGRALAAVRLEEFWNEISKDYPFCLFCAYMQDSLEEKTTIDQISEIGRCHSEILPTHENERFQEALDLASRDIYGIPLSQLIGDTSRVENPGEDRLPTGQRSMLWMIRNLPASSSKILEAAKRYYAPRIDSRNLNPDTTVVLRPLQAD